MGLFVMLLDLLLQLTLNYTIILSTATLPLGNNLNFTIPRKYWPFVGVDQTKKIDISVDRTFVTSDEGKQVPANTLKNNMIWLVTLPKAYHKKFC